MEITAKLLMSGADNDAGERFCKAYTARSGKQEFHREVVKTGFILKETGLQDILLNLDADPAFRDAPNTVKTRMLLAELSQLFAGVQPVATAEPVRQEQPAQAAPLVEENESTEVAKPAAVAKAPQPVAKKKPMPNLGV